MYATKGFEPMTSAILYQQISSQLGASHFVNLSCTRRSEEVKVKYRKFILCVYVLYLHSCGESSNKDTDVKVTKTLYKVVVLPHC